MPPRTAEFVQPKPKRVESSLAGAPKAAAQGAELGANGAKPRMTVIGGGETSAQRPVARMTAMSGEAAKPGITLDKAANTAADTQGGDASARRSLPKLEGTAFVPDGQIVKASTLLDTKANRAVTTASCQSIWSCC